MTIEKLFKPLKGIATGLAMLVAVAGCGDGGSSSVSDPAIKIARNFGNGYSGEIEYDISVEAKKPVDFVEVSINGGSVEKYINDSQENPYEMGYVAKIKKENAIDVYAGNAHESDAFSAMSEKVATGTTDAEDGVVDEPLVNNGYNLGTNYNKNVSYFVSAECGNINEVDYSVTDNNSPLGEIIIEYVSDTDDLTEKLNDKTKLDCADIPNKYFVNLPKEETKSRLQGWINNNFNN